MDAIDHPTAATSSGRSLFTEGSPATGVPATVITADWLNGVQGEMLTVIQTAGLAPSGGDHTQLLQAIRTISSTALVRQPINLGPAAGAIGVSGTPTLSASPYYSLYGVAQGQARFEIATSPSFVPILHSGTVEAVASYAVPDLVLTTTGVYWWRVAYADVEGHWSAPSTPTAFTCAAIFSFVSRPTNLTPANGSAGAALQPTLTSSPFSVVAGADAHAASRWRVSTVPSFDTVVYDSGISAGALTSVTLPSTAALTPLTVYYFQCQHQGATLGWSDWSAPTAFTAGAGAGEWIFSTPGATNFTVPVGVTLLTQVTVVGGGGGGGYDTSQYDSSEGGPAGNGGVSIKYNLPVTPGQVFTIVVPAGGSLGQPGGSASFGTLLSATGGAAGPNDLNQRGADGTGIGGDYNPEYRSQFATFGGVSYGGGGSGGSLAFTGGAGTPGRVGAVCIKWGG
ncbi:hypothetical protein D3877_09960 [Azospirillum cavernae]|uniref:Glycine-rich domain-containing protein n=1 Tax=Azospirillum cavernae TaxID=2320860 RepID=A0A418W4C5_9PROT|nr:hypothetical protein [Azospirillum cavernae]RJF84797.1 hypothetical protein D3877_09960 [Azospirillum cavernae]